MDNNIIALIGLALVMLGNIVAVVYKYSQLQSDVKHLDRTLQAHLKLEETYHAAIATRGDKRDDQLSEVLTKLARLEAVVRGNRYGAG